MKQIKRILLSVLFFQTIPAFAHGEIQIETDTPESVKALSDLNSLLRKQASIYCECETEALGGPAGVIETTSAVGFTLNDIAFNCLGKSGKFSVFVRPTLCRESSKEEFKRFGEPFPRETEGTVGASQVTKNAEGKNILIQTGASAKTLWNFLDHTAVFRPIPTQSSKEFAREISSGILKCQYKRTLPSGDQNGKTEYQCEVLYSDLVKQNN